VTRGTRAIHRLDRRWRRPGRRVAEAWVRAYFDVSYGLLVGSEAGRRVLRHAGSVDGPVHGYFTAEDRDVLLADLDPQPGHRLLDLGSGLGGIALEIHRRTGADIIGIDLSPRAIATATRRARRAGVGHSVTFVGGTLVRPPVVDASNAYAIDSLMFLPDLTGAIRGIGDALEPSRRLFATLLVVGPNGRDRLVRSLETTGVSVERLDDVTAALGVRSRARALTARTLLRDRATTLRGRLAMLVVVSEEALVRVLIARGQVSRWRFVVRYL